MTILLDHVNLTLYHHSSRNTINSIPIFNLSSIYNELEKMYTSEQRERLNVFILIAETRVQKKNSIRSVKLVLCSD